MRDRLTFAGVFVVALAALSTIAAPNGALGMEGREPNALIVLQDGYYSSPRQVIDALAERGGDASHIFWPRTVIAYVPESGDAGVVAMPGVRSLLRTGIELDALGTLNRTERAGVVTWNRLFAPDREIEIDETPVGGFRAKGDVALTPPAPASPAPRRLNGSSSLPYGADFYDTSEYMIGSVAVGIVFIESDGTIDPSTENWTQAKEDVVFSRIVQGYGEWDAASPYALSFVYQSEDSILTGYEPINRFITDDHLWLGQIMPTLGYPGPNRFETTRAYINDLRDAFDTDWSVVTFQVNATNDPDGVFADGFIGGYSYYGGPYNHVAYDDNGGAIPHDDICAHELGHTFYALDEYASAQVACTTRNGYLNWDNQNSEFPSGQCSLNLQCRMRLAAPNLLCNPTRRQIGWQDGDGDGIPAILDTDPETVLSDGLVSGSTVSYTGSADVNPLTNANPFGQQHDISLNTITNVEFRIDGGTWTAATPSDGQFDSGAENYHFTTPTLANGGHLIESRSTCSVGNSDQTFAADSATITATGVPGVDVSGGLPMLSIRPNPFSSRVTIGFRVPRLADGVEIRIHDTQGRLVYSAHPQASDGQGELAWDGVAANGEHLSAGIYFVSIRAAGFESTQDIVLMR